MYHLEPLCTPLICQRLHVPSTVKGQVDHTISRRCAAVVALRVLAKLAHYSGGRHACSASAANMPARPSRAVDGGVDGVPCRVVKYPARTIVNVGTVFPLAFPSF